MSDQSPSNTQAQSSVSNTESKRDPSQYTPMIQQFLEIKDQYPHTLLMYRMGDFYETFFEDAEVASRELEITLTSRDGGGGQRISMAGVPHHALEAYLPKLIERGYKVAICEQMEAPKPGKLVKREVVRVITPGTLLEGALLKEKRNNYLGAVCRQRGGFGLAYVDISTGEFKLTQMTGEQAADLLSRELAGLDLVELILPSKDPWQEKAVQQSDWAPLIPDPGIVSWENEMAFHASSAEDRVKKHFGIVSLEAFGCQNMPLGVQAAGAILHYLGQTQMSALAQIQEIKSYQLSRYMLLDRTTRRNLELVQTQREQAFEGSLLWVLDHCATAMGSRMIRDWLNHPLLDLNRIHQRHDAVAELLEAGGLKEEIQSTLDRIRDVERLAARVATQTASPRELKALAESLHVLPVLSEILQPLSSELIEPLCQVNPELQRMGEVILDAIEETPPIKILEGGIFRDGFHEELDELRSLISGGKDWIQRLEQSERERTGIKSLKVRFNKAFGYFIEVTHSNTALVPEDYIRKQTLTNAERYITPALKEKEAAVLNADEQIKNLEYRLFVALREKAVKHVQALQALAVNIAQLDVLTSLATAARKNEYTRPLMDESSRLNIRNGRHPVIECTLPSGHFVPNDTTLDIEAQSLMILTGPNMSGKSSYMRQVGLIVLLAQMGSFVPAEAAQIGLCDRIFTRVGAVDDIATGQSTFMVEMTETSNILHHATARSLILLDEIGRGTSTFDGVSIAWSVSEYIAKTIGARTLFATHYHELNRLAESLPMVCNYQVSVQENADGIRFLHKVVPGGADRSYGIEVARLAGLPQTVLSRARGLLNEIEKRSRIQSGLMRKHRKAETGPNVEQLSLFQDTHV